MREPSFGYIFKIILKVIGGLFLIGLVGICFTSSVMLFILGGSAAALLAWFAGVWNSIVQYNNLEPNPPAMIPLQASPIAVQQPNIILTEIPTIMLPTSTIAPSEPILTSTPTSLPFSKDSGKYYVWTTTDIPLYGFTIDLMQGWYLTEKRLPVGDACSLGHDLANYIVAPIIGSEIDINFLCGGRGWANSVCPTETVILDESRGIVRTKVTNNEYLYEHFSRNKNGMECVDGWNITDKVVMMADYKVTMGLIELPMVDRIVLSVHKK